MKYLIVTTVSFIVPIFFLLAACYGSPDGAWDAAIALLDTDAGEVYGMVLCSLFLFILCISNFFDALFDIIKNRRSAKADQRECPAEPVK